MLDVLSDMVLVPRNLYLSSSYEDLKFTKWETCKKNRSITCVWFGNYWPSFPPLAVRMHFGTALGHHQRHRSSTHIFLGSLPAVAAQSLLLQNSVSKRTDSSGWPVLPQNPPKAQGIHSWGSSQTHSLDKCPGINLRGKADRGTRKQLMSRGFCTPQQCFNS